MFRRLPLVAAMLVALAGLPADVRAQDAWAAFSPDGEEFAVLTPAAPTAAPQQQLRAGDLKAEGRRYEAKAGDGATYLVLSLRDADGAGKRLVEEHAVRPLYRASPYLDAIAEMAWEILVRPEVRKLRKPWGVNPSLYFRRDFELGGKPAREYLIKLGKGSGPVYVCADGPRIYVVAAFGPEARSAGLKQFVDSFALGARTPAAAAAAETKADSAAATGGGVGPGRGGYTGGGFGGMGGGRGDGTIDYSRPFPPGQVTRKAQVTSRPEPSYTAAARKFQVTGTVHVRALLGASGEVERITVVRGLTHGLTQRAVEAARRIKFEPAEKDGRKVSQYVAIDYNFSIY